MRQSDMGNGKMRCSGLVKIKNTESDESKKIPLTGANEGKVREM